MRAVTRWCAWTPIFSIPPALLGRILEAFEDGYEVVNMVRTRNESAGKVKNLTSRLFYRMLNALSDIHFENNASDFFAISANVAQIMRRDFRERARFLRGYIPVRGLSPHDDRLRRRAARPRERASIPCAA